MLLITLLEKLVILHHRPPTRALWEISTGELVFITADDQIAGPYLLKTQELPGYDPDVGCMWRTCFMYILVHRNGRAEFYPTQP